ncbi:hypothetical protein [Yersinia hibernica]|uniref:Uncharacterized protein n=1 Tax=Yersinia enterocolitica LC20 TaxID=1443113 RepID=A0A7U4K052_YEREN|nr:hypothetical protein [Yersinia hibernica]AHM72339.1 hypothetical protein LC20_01083 [Yersinia hibernica]OVZ90011.1 hypothetical protein CBW54_07925 [Yersinia kristensenii]
MRKKITQTLCLGIFLGVGGGYGLGCIYAYIHPMKDIEGYWEVNYDFKNVPEIYHVHSRVSVIRRKIDSSADVYDENDCVKARRNIVFNVVDTKKNIFVGKVLSLSVENGKERYLCDFLNTPYAVSHPIFYRLNDNTLLLEQSQGHPVNSLRLLTRIDKHAID